MPVQYLYSAEATKGEAYCFVAPFSAEVGDLIEHDGEIFTITKRAYYFAEDDAVSLLADFIHIYPADSIYSVHWKREGSDATNS